MNKNVQKSEKGSNFAYYIEIICKLYCTKSFYCVVQRFVNASMRLNVEAIEHKGSLM